MERDIVATSQREAGVPSFRDGYRGEDYLKGCRLATHLISVLNIFGKINKLELLSFLIIAL